MLNKIKEMAKKERVIILVPNEFKKKEIKRFFKHEKNVVVFVFSEYVQAVNVLTKGRVFVVDPEKCIQSVIRPSQLVDVLYI